MTIKLIVGLANPGIKYISTRHNVGSWYINFMVTHHNQSLKKETKFYGYTGRITIGNNNVRLLIPTTFMNLSGKAVAAMATFYRFTSKEILIAHDELSLLPGQVRLKLGGSHGGHNGLKNIIHHLGNNPNFYRLRIGIGHPGDKNKVVNFVLGIPTITEKQLIDDTINKAIRYIESLITQHNLKNHKLPLMYSQFINNALSFQ